MKTHPSAADRVLETTAAGCCDAVKASAYVDPLLGMTILPPLILPDCEERPSWKDLIKQ